MEKIPASAIFTPETLKYKKYFTRGARVVQVTGLVFTAYDLKQATEKSIEKGSVKPITAEVIRSTGGWEGLLVQKDEPHLLKQQQFLDRPALC